jgi:hypothetical protein
MNVRAICYYSGEDVRLGDLVDVGHGHGQKARVVVIIQNGQALDGFNVQEWAFLQEGIMLQDETTFGLLHLPTLDEEYILVSRA